MVVLGGMACRGLTAVVLTRVMLRSVATLLMSPRLLLMVLFRRWRLWRLLCGCLAVGLRRMSLRRLALPQLSARVLLLLLRGLFRRTRRMLPEPPSRIRSKRPRLWHMFARLHGRLDLLHAHLHRAAIPVAQFAGVHFDRMRDAYGSR